eukprot:TRINITY_DN2131_c0_g4_i3.p1 TRINITY_DN2131_c0_g4~~TRINITY_DN2131_c0_g4_i3.p1  ORF type:complete len:523 (-),score=117.65 TRINITY_DN2131_c0_g4_i3:253-1821(-)
MRHGWGTSFHAAHLCLLGIFLTLTRYKSRAGLFNRCRSVIRPIAGEGLVFLSQWWSILFIVLTVELVFTSLNAVDMFQGAEGLTGNKEWLAKMSMGVLPACVVTYLLSFFAIVRQLLAAYRDARQGTPWQRNLRWVLQWSRDVAVQVLFMPMVYHLMMCRVVLHQWAAVTGNYLTDAAALDAPPEVKSELEVTLAAASSSFAEMYDAYALLCFGNLGMLVAEHELGRRSVVSGDASGLVAMDTQRTQVLLPLLRATLLFGVKAYVVTSIASSLYSIGLAYLNIVWDPGLCSALSPSLFTTSTTTAMAGADAARPTTASGHAYAEAWCIFKSIMYGADFATSTIAIYNLFSFEHLLHKPLKKFNPGLKFWSMKIPVSLAFSEIIVLKLLQPFIGLTNDEVDIFDAVSKAYFMVLVAVLNVCAWSPVEDWYYWEEVRDYEYRAVAAVPQGEDGDSATSDGDDSESDLAHVGGGSPGKDVSALPGPPHSGGLGLPGASPGGAGIVTSGGSRATSTSTGVSSCRDV